MLIMYHTLVHSVRTLLHSDEDGSGLCSWRANTEVGKTEISPISAMIGEMLCTMGTHKNPWYFRVG